MKPMLLTAADEIPSGDDWLFETKYDGFRCMLVGDEKPKLVSRNGNDLTAQFPEIIAFCDHLFNNLSTYLPLTLDGELVHLLNEFKSDFSVVQTRGRMRSEKSIASHVDAFPCVYKVFDLLRLKGNDLTGFTYTERKAELNNLFQSFPRQHADTAPIQEIVEFKDAIELWNEVVLNNGEGLVAKKTTSIWTSGQRTPQWLKIKNWKYITVVLMKYDQNNGFFSGGVYREGILLETTVFRHGLTEEELQILITFFQSNGKRTAQGEWIMEPSICVDIACIDFDGKKLREPRFHAFNFSIDPSEVDWRNMQRQLNPPPAPVHITHPTKPVWPAMDITKDDYLIYLQHVSPYLLPFLKDRLLTGIRYPHGAPGESFYQKNAPDYAPDFISTMQVEGIRYILCNDNQALLWLGNQLTLEFHIPFQTVKTSGPTEIVFDLDPPSVNEFHLATEAAIRMKAIFDHFNLHSLVKTSGGKGLQVYIPLPENTFTYEETRIFTEFICTFLCDQEPHLFTMERLKKNRHNRLYLDYVQHGEGKTIVAPYSPRGNEQGLIATPLTWDEVNNTLRPDLFTIPTVLKRLQTKGDPFRYFRQIGDEQKFNEVLYQLKGESRG